MFQKILKIFKNGEPRTVTIGENTYTCPSGNDGYKGGHNSGPVSPRPPPPKPTPKFFFEKEPARYFDGCGWHLPATEGSVRKGGINEGPSVPRPSPPTMTPEGETSPPDELYQSTAIGYLCRKEEIET